MVNTSYLRFVLDRDKRRNLKKSLVQFIRSKKVKFDSIAFMGFSGALIAPYVCDTLHKIPILVRKEPPDTKNHHSYYQVEFSGNPSEYIIVDDLIDDGNTVRNIHRIIKKQLPYTYPELKGIFLYNHKIEPSGYIQLSEELNVPIFGFFCRE